MAATVTSTAMERELELFRECLEFIREYSVDQVRELFPDVFVFDDATAFASFNEKWRTLKWLAEVVFEQLETIATPNRQLLSLIEQIVLTYSRALNNNEVKIFVTLSNVLMADINQMLGYRDNFHNIYHSTHALSGYIDVASEIRRDPGFNSTILCKFEHLLSDPFNCIRRNTSERSRPINIRPENFDRAAVALVSPSLTGKTQSAFVLQTVKPLYFALNQNYSSPTQPIYLSFKSLNMKIESLIFKDLQGLRRFLPVDIGDIIPETPRAKLSTQPEPIFEAMGARLLAEEYSNYKYYTLGFLEKLVIRAGSDFDENRTMPWMRYWSEQDDFSFEARSIADLQQRTGFFSRFCLFLDEYVGYVEFVLLKNLAVAIGLRCVVSNTNSDVSNLVGMRQGTLTNNIGTSDVWSMVVTTLGPISRFVFDVIFNRTFEQFCALTVARCEQPDELRLFITDFSQNQMLYLRPGCFKMVLDAFQKAIEVLPERFTFCQWLDKIVKSMSTSLLQRKNTINAELTGIVANYLLFFENAYESGIDDSFLAKSKSLLENHLYYLTNPVDSNEWVFLTFQSANSTKFLSVHRGSFILWERVKAHIYKKELLTIMGCMAIDLQLTIAYATLQEGVFALRLLRAVPNPSAMKRDGNALEVFASAAIIDATHHRFNSDMVSFTGQDGLTFLQTFFRNLFDQNGTQMLNAADYFPISFSQEDARIFNLESFLRSSHVPFLMPTKISPHDILVRLNNRGVISVGTCERPPDAAKIDFKFKFSPTTVPSLNRTGISDFHAVAECKNWSLPITHSKLEKIIVKAVASRACLSFITCNMVKASRSTMISNFCSVNRINIYELNTARELVKFRNTRLFNDPTMILIIVELRNILQ